MSEYTGTPEAYSQDPAVATGSAGAPSGPPHPARAATSAPSDNALPVSVSVASGLAMAPRVTAT